MKTIGDLERWLKGAGQGFTLKLTAERDKFNVHYAKPGADGIFYIAPKSATLEGAFENLLEELRRKDNGAESMRTEKKDAAFQATLAAVQKTAQTSLKSFITGNVGGSVGSVSPPPPYTAQQTLCPDCSHLPQGIIYGSLWTCGGLPCQRTWAVPSPVAGTVYRLQLRGRAPEDWRWNGSGGMPQWTKVSP
jgi:hypothetical protein